MTNDAANFLGDQATRPGQGRCDAPGGCQHTQGFGRAWASCERRSFDHRATVVRAADDREYTTTHARARIRHARACVLERGDRNSVGPARIVSQGWPSQRMLGDRRVASSAACILAARDPTSQRTLGDRGVVSRSRPTRTGPPGSPRNGCSEAEALPATWTAEPTRNGRSETDALPGPLSDVPSQVPRARNGTLGNRGVARTGCVVSS